MDHKYDAFMPSPLFELTNILLFDYKHYSKLNYF